MSAHVGSSRGGIVNSTEGFPNTTPKYGAYHGDQNMVVDIDSPQDSHRYHQQQQDHHTTKRLETIVDRIVRRAGPPQSSLGNPGPLGLAGFAATTFMLSCWNAGLLVSTTENIVLPMALWYGGIAQLLAGMWEFAANNTFGATAFTSYGAFWLSFATLNEFWAPTGYAAAKDVNAAVGMYLMAWTIFTGYMFIGTLRMSYSLVAVFFFLTITFACLTAAKFTHDPVSAGMVGKAGGWFGIITAFAAWYASAAVVINGTFGAQLLPVGVIGPLTHQTKGLPNALRRRVTASNLNETSDDADMAAAPVNYPKKV